MQLTRFTDYALRTLIYLAGRPVQEKVALSYLAESFEMNLHHLNKVSQKLTQMGYLVSTRGKQGGISLARSPESISVGDVVRDMEPCLAAIDCDGIYCPIRSSCRLRGVLGKASQAFIRELDGVKLSDVSVTITDGQIPSVTL
ncbi:hypothetical protein BTA51_15705 [Hahella sp. CCB-MM4]|uniref:RrF2 family transcriptional regulator n=1 Tax=Hahella sp. (strain CCB-MM4) TaxID=1926491 RepID=UPI000B9C382D|nr:Rrf2 family transcriptional regulator [Hahella sp. CCB-MM4]OZG72559.1 hypothetical protein BTA51_15705 [Hahella sp. CCB-MM4]